MEFTFKEIELTKINLQPGDTLAVTIKSDELDQEIMDSIKTQLKKGFPNNKVMVYGLDPNGSVEFTSIASDQTQAQSYCTDCNCGKKESS